MNPSCRPRRGRRLGAISGRVRTVGREDTEGGRTSSMPQPSTAAFRYSSSVSGVP